MSLAAEIQQIRADIDQLKRSRKPSKRRQQPLSVRVDPETNAIIRQTAALRGVSIGTIMREAIAIAVHLSHTDHPDIPSQFHAHRKPDRFDDGKSPRIKDPAREAADRTYQQLLDGNAATLADRRSRNAQEPTEGKLSETVARPAVPRIVPKPSR